MESRTELEWSYQPEDFFEGSFVIGLSNGELVADGGKAVLSLNSPMNPILAVNLQKFKDEVVGVFEVRQLTKHRPFELNGPTTIQIAPDGSRSVSIFVTGVSCIVVAGVADIVVTDANGKVISDTKADRLTSEMNLMTVLSPKLAKCRNLQGMVRSYGQAVRDPQNELVHLYEIRDALAKIYDERGRAALGINKADWSTLGRFANDEPLREGRHRGKKLDELRPATQAELAEARRIARDLIQAYASIL